MSNRIETRIYPSPIKSHYTITDRFLYTRGRPTPHAGIDLVCRERTSIFCPTVGRVTLVGVSETGGNYIVVENIVGMRFEFCHLRTPPLRLMGDVVDNECYLGEVGETGHCPGGPHLHFGISIKNAPSYLRTVGLNYEKFTLTYLNPEWFVRL